MAVLFTSSVASCVYDSGSLAVRLREMRSEQARYWRSVTMLDLTAWQVMVLLIALAAAIVSAVAWNVWRRD